jgi:hypothetical protein
MPKKLKKKKKTKISLACDADAKKNQRNNIDRKGLGQ